MPWCSRRTPSTVSAFCISHTFPFLASGHLFPFALQAAFPPPLAGRYSHDYYGNSVAIGLASLGDPAFVFVIRDSAT